MKIILFLLLLSLFIYWLYWFLRTMNPYKFILNVGKKGSGKTTWETKTALNYDKHSKLIYDSENEKKLFGIVPWGFRKQKFSIYSNTELNGVEYTYFNPLELGVTFFPPPYSILFIDEISIFWLNRMYKSMNPKTLEWFRMQRKYKCIVHGYSQSFDVDKVLRELTDGLFLIRPILNTWSFKRKIVKFPAIVDTRTDATKQLVDQIQFASILVPKSIQFLFIPKYIKYFNTLQIIKKDA